jgi:tetratricopeptide (TPR) repeat protein
MFGPLARAIHSIFNRGIVQCTAQRPHSSYTLLLPIGKGSMEDIHKEIDKIPDSALKRRNNFYGYYYIGLYYEAMQNVQKAIENITLALKYGANIQDYMVEVAKINLQQLTKQL